MVRLSRMDDYRKELTFQTRPKELLILIRPCDNTRLSNRRIISVVT